MRHDTSIEITGILESNVRLAAIALRHHLEKRRQHNPATMPREMRQLLETTTRFIDQEKTND